VRADIPDGNIFQIGLPAREQQPTGKNNSEKRENFRKREKTSGINHSLTSLERY
jgi:hypothetical protein